MEILDPARSAEVVGRWLETRSGAAAGSAATARPARRRAADSRRVPGCCRGAGERPGRLTPQPPAIAPIRATPNLSYPPKRSPSGRSASIFSPGFLWARGGCVDWLVRIGAMHSQCQLGPTNLTPCPTERKLLSSGSPYEATVGFSRAVRVGIGCWCPGQPQSGPMDRAIQTESDRVILLLTPATTERGAREGPGLR